RGVAHHQSLREVEAPWHRKDTAERMGGVGGKPNAVQSSTHARPTDNVVLGGWLSFSFMGKRVTNSRETDVLQHNALCLSSAVKEGQFIRGAIFPATDKNLMDRIPYTCSPKILNASHNNPTILAQPSRRENFVIQLLSFQAYLVPRHSAIN
ncbi:unnamed protein product, partial [Ectocarpus sp. 13 AM-2016]